MIPARAHRRAGCNRAAGMYLIVLAIVAALLALDASVSCSCLCVYDPWLPYAAASYALLALLLAGWPIWRHLAPRSIPALRTIAALAGLGMLVAAQVSAWSVEAFELLLHAYGLVALALYAEIARGLLDRRRHRSRLVPQMHARPRRARASAAAAARIDTSIDASIDAPISLGPP